MFKRKKKQVLSPEEENLNRLWERYADGELEKECFDVYVLCEYESAVNGEGHSGFFFNDEVVLADYREALMRILPKEHRENYIKALESYDTENEEEVCNAADEFFYGHEQEIIDILQEYANRVR